VPILFGLIILGKHVCPNKVEKERDPLETSSFNSLARMVTSSKDRQIGAYSIWLNHYGNMRLSKQSRKRKRSPRDL
jgi:hypothetical protein